MLRKYFKRTSFMIASCFILQGLIPLNVLAQTPTPELMDLGTHWASEPVKGWTSKGLIKGYEDGTFKPDAYITRAQFIALVNRAFGYMTEQKVDFKDIKASDWFYKEVEKAKAVGYISGYEDGTIKPNSSITRQEAAAIVSRILKLKAAEGQSAAGQFKDADRIAKWSKDVVNAIVKEGYMKGYADGTFKPESFITRAESVAMLDRVVGELYYTAGVQGTDAVKTIKGNVTINTKDVTLKNTVLEGNLYLTEGIGEGEVTLDNVTVKGRTLIGGGGPNSITIKDCTLGRTEVSKPKGQVRLFAVGKTSVQEVTANSAVKFETKDITGTGFGKIVISKEVPANAAVQFAGDFKNVEIAASNIKVEVVRGTIEKLEVGKDVKDTKVETAQAAKITTLINSQNSTTPTAPTSTSTSTPAVQPSGGGTSGGGGSTGTTPPATSNPQLVNSISLTIGGSDVVVNGENNVFTVDLQGRKSTDMFTGISVNGSSDAKQATVNFNGFKENISFSNGTATATVSEMLGPLDPQKDGVSVTTLKDFSDKNGTSITITVEDTSGNKTNIEVKLKP